MIGKEWLEVLADKIEYIELGELLRYERLFVEYLQLPSK